MSTSNRWIWGRSIEFHIGQASYEMLTQVNFKARLIGKWDEIEIRKRSLSSKVKAAGGFMVEQKQKGPELVN